MANRERVVEFAVKARDEYSKVLKNLEQQQTRLSAAARADQRRAVTGLAKEEFDQASANYKRLLADVERYRAAQANAAKSGKLSAAELRELGETIKLTRDRAREALTALNQKRVALDKLGAGARVGYAAFDRLAVSMQRSSAGAREGSAAASGSAAQLNKLAASSGTAAAAQGTLSKRIDGVTAAMNRQRKQGGVGKGFARGEDQDVEVWGLKPWQLTNLGYQVNDVVSGLAMGQAPIQILAQQAGQLAQIWPNLMVSMARSVPTIAAVTAVLAPFAATAMRLYDAAESVRIFSQNLDISADGARYSAEDLAKAADEMRDFSVATSDARDMLLQFVRDGISERDFKPLAEMAKRLSEISGDTVAEAGAKLSKAFSGTVEDVRELDQELNFLTASQLETIRAMAKAGDTAGALSLAQEILRGRLADTVQESGPWSEAVNSMANAWDNFIGALEESGLIQRAASHLRALGIVAKNTAGLIEDATAALAPGTELEQAIARLHDLNALIAEERQLTAAGMNAVDDLQALIDERNAVLAILDARREHLEIIKDGSEAQRAATEAEKKDQLDIQLVIDKQLEALRAETKQAELTNRERYIEEELLKAKNAALEQAKKLNQDILGLTEEQTRQIRDQAGAAYDAAHRNYEAEYTAVRGTPQGAQMADIVKYATILAESMKLSVKDILTAVSFETGGTFNPSIRGGAGNRHVGLFQAGPAAQTRYGIDENSSVKRQFEAMGKYLVDAGVKAGDGLLQIYAAINAGRADRIHASDANNGGTPGTVLDKVSEQMEAHKAKAEGALAAYAGIAEEARKTAEYERGFEERLKATELELEAKKLISKEAYVAKELADEEARARKAGVTLTQEQVAKFKELATAQWEVNHANDEVNRLVALRTSLFQSLQIAQQAGDQGKVMSVVAEIGQVEAQLDTAIPKAIQFWQALGGPGAAQAIAELEAVQASIGQVLQRIDRQFLPSAIEINEQLADIGANAFSAFARAIAQGENAADAFFDALLQGIAEFLIEIGKAIVKQAIFNAISGGAGAAGGGGIGGAIGGWIASIFHDGGVVGGRGAPNRLVDASIFADATRYHVGGLAGLKPGEVPIVAMEEEEILTREDPRHVLNGGKGPGAVNIKNVNVFDPNDVMEASLATVAGERVMLNFLTRNSRKVAAAING